MKENMTIHKALSELKVLDSRIDSKISGVELVIANKHSNQKIHGVSIEAFCSDAKDGYQSIKTLINRRNAIKRAVTRSNAVTTVEIGGNQYTVAEAIDMKAKGVEYLENLASKLEAQYAHATKLADAGNGDRLDERADEYVKTMYGSTDLKNAGEDIRKVRETFIASQTMEVIDPINAFSEAQKLREEIDAFLSDVDSALSVSNALTTIEVEYETF